MKSKGTIFVLLSSVCYGLAPLFTKIALEEGFDTYSFLFLRTCACLPILALLIYMNKLKARIGKKEVRVIVFLACSYVATIALLTISYLHIPTGLSMSLHFGYPAFVVILAFAFLGQKPRPIHLICIVLSLFGIFLMQEIKGDFHAFGVGAAIVSGLTHAIYMLIVKHSALKDTHPLTLNFYTQLFSFLIIASTFPFKEKLQCSLSMKGWLAFFAMTMMVTILAVLFLQTGLRYISAQRAAILSTLEPVTSVLLGILIFSEQMSFQRSAGLLLVLGSVVILNLNQQNHSEKTTQ